VPILITSAEQVTQEWLEAVLHARGDLPNGKIASFIKKASKPFGATTVQIEVDYGQLSDPELPTRFLLKIDGPDSPAGNREVAFYTRFNSALSRSHTARCFDAVYDDTQRAYHVLLEDLTETHYTIEREAPPTQAESEAMIDTLATLHAAWWGKLGDDVRLIDNDLLTEQSGAYFSQFVDFMGERLTAQRRKIYERIFQNLPNLLKKRLDSAATLVHDDAHPWNFLHPRDLEKRHAVIVDWQQWGRSVGAYDVAIISACFGIQTIGAVRNKRWCAVITLACLITAYTAMLLKRAGTTIACMS